MDASIRRSSDKRSDLQALAALRPEDVFLAWLIGLPRGTNVAQAARVEIARIDRAAASHAGISHLRDLLAQAAGLQPANTTSPTQ